MGTAIAWNLLSTAGTSAGTTSVRKPAPGIQTAVLTHIGYADLVTGSECILRSGAAAWHRYPYKSFIASMCLGTALVTDLRIRNTPPVMLNMCVTTSIVFL